MTAQTRLHPTVRVAAVKADIERQIEAGRHLLALPIGGAAEINATEQRVRAWSEANRAILQRAFVFGDVAAAYARRSRSLAPRHSSSLPDRVDAIARAVVAGASALEDVLSGLDDVDERSIYGRVFIGHGRSPDWRELKEFIEGRLGLPTDEFNRTPVAGRANSDRLREMLDAAALALLVLSAEDERTDGTLQARQNVIHEAGLFQGRLGWGRAIILLEDGCAQFSNIDGLGHIGFPAGRIRAAFEDVRLVAEREGLAGR